MQPLADAPPWRQKKNWMTRNHSNSDYNNAFAPDGKAAIEKIQKVVHQKSVEWQLLSAALSQQKEISLPADIEAQQTPLHMAIATDNPKLLCQLLQSGAQQDEINQSNQSPLHYAALIQRWNCVRAIIDTCSSVKIDASQAGYVFSHLLAGQQFEALRALMHKNTGMHLNCALPPEDNTILHLACLHGAPQDMIDDMLAMGAKFNYQNKVGETPLHLAVRKDRADIVARLIKAGADLTFKNAKDDTPADIAGSLHHFACLQALVEHAPLVENDAAHFGSALVDCLAAREFQIAKSLLEKRPVINMNWGLGDKNSLHLAILNDAPVDLISLIIDKKCDLDLETAEEDTPLHLAVREDREEIVAVLVKAGADLTLRNKAQETPVHVAGELKRFDCLKALIKHAVVVDNDDADFGGGLLEAINAKQFKIAEFLMEKRSVIHMNWCFTNTLNTCLHTAILRDAPLNLISSIVKNVKLEAKNIDGDTPLHLAFKQNHTPVVELLIKAGASIAIRNRKNQTPLELASHDVHVESLNALLTYTPAMSGDDKLFGQALLDTLQCGQFRAARGILAATRKINFKWSCPDTHMNALHISVLQQAPLDIINALLRKGVSARKEDKHGKTPLNFARDRRYKNIAKILKKPASYNVNVAALGEFFKLHQLGHWHISKLPKEVMVLIAQQLGHDDYFANQLLTIAEQKAKATFQLFSDFRNACYAEPLAVYHFLLDQYSNSPQAIETALVILASMKELYPASPLDVLLSTKHQRIAYRKAQMIRLSEILISRRAQSPLAFYLRGIHGRNGCGYLLKAKYLVTDFDLNGLSEEQYHDLNLRLSQMPHR